MTSKGYQYEGGDHHPVGSDDQCRCLTELNKNGGGRDRHDSNAKEDDETDHLD
jgi:hypothetical protein